jgi:DNA polymerase IV (DinB-like DNA polymerase)
MHSAQYIFMNRIIAHLDMDAFFASVEERDNPKIKGLPIVVGSDPMEGQGRGVVSTANYKAREYGIRSALPISKAWQFSQNAKRKGLPEAVFLDVDFAKYSRASEEIMKIVRKYSSITEQASVDEMYLDLSSFLKPGFRNFRKAEDICREIKKEIWEKEKLTASIGLGQNKLVAKIASDMQKPDGLTVITPEKTEEFLEPLSIRKIPGIGPKTEQLLNSQKIFLIKDLKNISQEKLQEMLGKWGLDLFEKARGIDSDPVSEDYEIKSIGEQTTFQNDSLDFKFVIEQLDKLCEGIFHSFQESDFHSFRTIVATIRFSNFETKNRSHTLAKPQKTLKILKIESMKLLMPFFDSRENPQRRKIRLIGVRIEKLK